MTVQTAVSDERVFGELQAVFGYTTFRPLQHEIVRSILEGQDVFVLMPTGGGKSLCFQLPALLMDGVTVVVSPLIALMKDQVDKLEAMGVAATFINSSLEGVEIFRRLMQVRQGEIKLLYVAPERLMTSSFLNMLSGVQVACFAIDEAHCISEWGHDFRPEYRDLARVRALFPSTPMATFTATATPRVQADIVKQLKLEKAASFRGSFNRANLFYEVRQKQGAYEQILSYVRAHPKASGIIYCLSRASTEKVAERLAADGIKATAYHAGLEPTRRKRQEAFLKDNVQVVAATIAFGMGIDKPDVRFVIHYDTPKNLEGYYQETGRAGWDGEPSECLLFYSHGDAMKQEHFIRQKETAAERSIVSQQLREMVGWAESTTCRRSALLAYFSENLEGQSERCCDVCDDDEPAELTDRTLAAQKFLSCAKRTGETFGATHLIRVLRGSKDERILSAGHDKISTYGIGRELERAEWQQIASALERSGYVSIDREGYQAVKVTEKGNAVLFRSATVMLPSIRTVDKRDTAAARAVAAADSLFDRLRDVRKTLADERGVPPYVVFHDTALRQMAEEKPQTPAAFLAVQGVGQRKLQDYGKAFLDVIIEHERVARAAAAERMKPKNVSKLGDTAFETLKLFRDGMSPVEIAASRQLAQSTIEGHLAQAVEFGEEVEIERLITEPAQRAIEAVLAEMGAGPMKPVFDRLEGKYSYGEIRVAQALMAVRSGGGGG